MSFDSEIAELDRRIAEYKRHVELLEAERKGMLAARRYLTGAASTPARPAPIAQISPPPSSGRGGRQPGAISQRWQAVLGDLYDYEFDAAAVAKAVLKLEGRVIKPAEVKRLFDGYIEHGLVGRTDGGLYFVTDAAAAKYGFKSPFETDENKEGRDERPSENVGGEMVRSDGYPPARSGGSIPPTSTGQSPLWPDVIPAGDDDE